MAASKGWWAIAGGVIVGLIPGFSVFGLLLITFGVWKIWSDKKNPANDVWMKEREGCEYKWSFDGTGIALDTKTKTIHLKDKKVQKSYPFVDIREWKYNVQTGGEIVNGPAGTNYGIHLRNK
jgi:hypothetical protein